ncbi:Na/Pi cotransporter family protein [Candidatus Sumerlaeota bacterium]|nr:Na/Pi cotransporter family protein [Candidatus Sumerlaeota bacterium]
MRSLNLIAPLVLVAASLGAATASPEAITLHRFEYIDENGQYTDASHDQSIWTTSPPQHAALRVQAVQGSAELPEPQPGHVARRPGQPGVRLFVESDPPGLTFHPGEQNSDWLTNGDGLFELIVPVPSHAGDYRFIFRTVDPSVHTLVLSISVKSPNWLLWLLLGMLGGLALFLHGMQLGSDGLQEAAGSRFRETLHTLTGRPIRGVMVGTVATIFTQSSSATTVMLVGFVRAGLMNLRQTFGPIFGAAIGTTLTVQLLSFKIQAYSLPLMAVGFLLMFFARRSPRTVAVGKIIFGFGMIFFGMAVMGEVIEPLKSSPAFRELIARLTSRPTWCLIVVTLFTALIQSSGATIGIALTLANQGLIDLHQSLPIIFGANIGTCVTAILASVGGTVEARRVAFAHLVYKVASVALFFFWFMPDVLAWMATQVSGLMAALLPSVPFLADTTARRMANADTIMCVGSAILAVLFFQTPLEKIVTWLIPSAPGGEKGEGRAKYLDLALLESPSLAIGSAVREISRMGRLTEEMIIRSHEAFEQRDVETLSWLKRRDDKVDRAFHRINTFLTRLTAQNPGKEVTERAISLLYVINDLESVGDLVDKILVPIVHKMIDQDLHLSEAGMGEIRNLHAQVRDSMAKSMVALTTPGEEELLDDVITRQEEMNVMGRRLHLNHLRRLQEGLKESIESTSVHLDLVNYLLRMHYHIYSIAWTVAHGVSEHGETP